MILALKTPLVETIIGTKIDFLNQFNIFFTLFFLPILFNSTLVLVWFFFFSLFFTILFSPLLLLNLSRDPFNSISYLHKSAWKSDLGRQTISQFVINYFFIPLVTCFWAWKILLLLLHYCLVKKAWGDTNCCRYHQ